MDKSRKRFIYGRRISSDVLVPTAEDVEMTPEKATKDAIKKYLKEIGAYYFMSVPVGYGASTLDFLICYKGKFYGVEAKREQGGFTTPRQHCVMREIAEAGGGVCVENHVDCRNVKELLK